MSNTFQHKLFHFEAEPSDKVWEAIAEKMDNSGDFIEKLKVYQEAPPPQVWNRISEELSRQPGSAPVAAPRPKYRKLVRYSTMAAAIFGAIILINLLTNKESSGDAGTQAATQSPAPASRPAVVPPGEEPASYPAPNTEKQSGDRLVESTDSRTAAAPVKKPLKGRYVTMANDDGQTVRLSRKAFSVIDCAEKTAPSSWSRCKENIQALQAKMATSIGAASGDFGSLIDMIKSLEEKQ